MSTGNRVGGLRLLTDQAIGEKDDSRGDGLGFAHYADVLSRAAIGTPGPLTIGVFGEWGTGKTSLMRMVERRFEGDGDVITIWFNAWQYEQDDNPLIPLVGTIVQALEKNRTFSSRLADGGKALVRALRAIVYGFSAKAEVQVPGFAKIEAGFVAKDMIEREEALSPDPLIDQSLYYRAFDALAHAPLPSKARVVVLIDDLDRCFPDKALRLLEGIKLVLSQKGFIFIIGVARRVLEGYLQHRYREEFGIANFDGSAYLDKIVQLAFPIPPHRERMESLARQLVAGLDDGVREEVESVVPLIAPHVGGNPRMLVRFINNVLIDVEVAHLTLGEDSVSLEFFAITRVLQLRWETFYNAVVIDQTAATFAADSSPDQWRKEKETGGASSRLVAELLLNHPDLARLVAEEPCKRWLLQGEQRQRAVLFLESSLRNSNRAGPAFVPRDEAVVTLVAGEPAKVGWMVRFLRELEGGFSSEHRAYGEADVADEVKAAVARAKHVVVASLGSEAQGVERRRKLESFLGRDSRLLTLPAPESEAATKETAARFLKTLFGAESDVARLR